MTRPRIPQLVLDAAHARRAARTAGDWDEADRLRGEIEAAGWRVIDRGVDFSLVPAHPPDLSADGRTRYGASQTVPSRLEEPAAAPATVILRATDDSLERTLAALEDGLPAGVQLIVVADDPAPDVRAELEDREAADDPLREVVWTSARLGPGASLNVGLRRSSGAVLLVIGPGVEPRDELLGPLTEALAPRDVAVAGCVGLAGRDVRDLRPAPAGDVAALDGQCLAVRRDLAVARGPVDERFAAWRPLAIWWTLVLRDEGEGLRPLRAIGIEGLLVSHEELPVTAAKARTPSDVDARLAKRDRYRLLERFGGRPDLFAAGRSG